MLAKDLAGFLARTHLFTPLLPVTYPNDDVKPKRRRNPDKNILFYHGNEYIWSRL